jgi:hypothetical protein
MKTAKLSFSLKEVDEAMRYGKLDELVFWELVTVYRRTDFFLPLAEDILVALRVFMDRHKEEDQRPEGVSQLSVTVELPFAGKAGAVAWEQSVSV